MSMGKTLEAFCIPEDNRLHVKRPFTQGDYTYAGDGAILLRVSKLEGYETLAGGQYPNAAALPWDHARLTDWCDLPEVDLEKLESCDECEGGKEPIKDCEWCDGTGKNSRSAVRFGSGHVAAYYLIKIKKHLAGVKISPYETTKLVYGSGVRGNPVRFTFDGGCGLLMPMEVSE